MGKKVLILSSSSRKGGILILWALGGIKTKAYRTGKMIYKR